MRRGVSSATVIAILVACPSAGAATLVGSNLANPANLGTCGFGTFAAENRFCLVSEQSQTTDVAPGGLKAPFDGVIVKWRMKTGTTSAAITEIRVGLRLLHGDTRGESPGMMTFPLTEPGLHTYYTRLPVKAGDRIGLDSVTNSIGVEGGDVPASYSNPGAGVLNQYPTPTGSSPSNITEEDSELLIQAEVEPDVDHDGFGDETQDGCPSNPASQAPCPSDHTPPMALTSISSRQNFVRLRQILATVRSNEAGTATVSGTLSIAGSEKTYDLAPVTQVIAANQKAKLHLDIGGKAVKAAKRALHHRKKVKALVTVQAKDLAGNAGGATQVTVRPSAPKRRH